MNILYVDLDKYPLDLIHDMVQKLETIFTPDDPLLVIPKDCRFVEDAPYEDLMNIKMIVDAALEEKKNDLPSK